METFFKLLFAAVLIAGLLLGVGIRPSGIYQPHEIGVRP